MQYPNTECLDDKLPVALYYQLKNIFLKKIQDGKWGAGEMIPTENELCKEYNVSRITVRQALSELEKQGYLLRKRGKGTYVMIPRIEQSLMSFYSFSEEFRKRGFKPGNKLLEYDLQIPSADIAERLKSENNKKVYYVKRLRYADDIPIAIESTYLPAHLFQGLNKHSIENKPLYDIFRDEYGIVPDFAEESFGADLISEKEAGILELKPGKPVLDIERTAFSGDKPIEYTTGVIRGDMFRFNAKMAK
jgi:GntR family transcriptional regulator